jgi:hypothetical protein
MRVPSGDQVGIVFERPRIDTSWRSRSHLFALHLHLLDVFAHLLSHAPTRKE